MERAGHIVSHVRERAKLYVVVILIFGYHFLFEEELMCSCENPKAYCAFNMCLPLLVILFALLWTDKRCQRACCHGRCCHMLIRFCHALFVSLIWPVSALIDADWTVCCFDSSHQNFTCKDECQLSDEELETINDLKGKSKIYGLSALLVLFFLAFLASLFEKKIKWCTRDNWEDIVLEEGDKFVPQKMREVAMLVLLDKLKNHIPESNWDSCFNVGEEVLTDPPSEETLSQITAAVTLHVTPGHQRTPSAHGRIHSDSDSDIPLLSKH